MRPPASRTHALLDSCAPSTSNCTATQLQLVTPLQRADPIRPKTLEFTPLVSSIKTTSAAAPTILQDIQARAAAQAAAAAAAQAAAADEQAAALAGRAGRPPPLPLRAGRPSLTPPHLTIPGSGAADPSSALTWQPAGPPARHLDLLSPQSLNFGHANQLGSPADMHTFRAMLSPLGVDSLGRPEMQGLETSPMVWPSGMSPYKFPSPMGLEMEQQLAGLASPGLFAGSPLSMAKAGMLAPALAQGAQGQAQAQAPQGLKRLDFDGLQLLEQQLEQQLGRAALAAAKGARAAQQQQQQQQQQVSDTGFHPDQRAGPSAQPFGAWDKTPQAAALGLPFSSSRAAL
jgi:hypothetical protein